MQNVVAYSDTCDEPFLSLFWGAQEMAQGILQASNNNKNRQTYIPIIRYNSIALIKRTHYTHLSSNMIKGTIANSENRISKHVEQNRNENENGWRDNYEGKKIGEKW